MSEIEEALRLLTAGPDRESPEFKPRMVAMTKLFRAYGEKDPDRLVAYVDALWTEVPVAWLALAVKRLIVERVYPTLPTVGDVRRVARRLAGMDRTVYYRGTYDDRGHREWPPFGQRHAVLAGTLERLDVSRVPLLPEPPKQLARGTEGAG